jgi:hypothetical protein
VGARLPKAGSKRLRERPMVSGGLAGNLSRVLPVVILRNRCVLLRHCVFGRMLIWRTCGRITPFISGTNLSQIDALIRYLSTFT